MSSRGEDCAVSDGVDTTVFHNEDGPSDSTGREDIVTLILTPVDPSHKPSLTLQPPIKKRILQKSKGLEDTCAAVRASASATDTLHLPVSKSIKGPEDTCAAVRASASATDTLHLPVSKSIKGPEDTCAAVRASASATDTLHLPVSKSNKFHYKIKDCPVHLNKDHFPFVKTMGTRKAKNGKKETKVRWQPCSGCGLKWKDTWEPYELFHADK